MAREPRRLLIDPERLRQQSLAGGGLPLQAEEQHYLNRVLRLRAGDGVELIDGRGALWRAHCGNGPWLVDLMPVITAAEHPQPQPRLTLALALPRREVELVWRMATELGLDTLQPLLADRCQGSGEPPWQRWQAILREATEQCERLWMPLLQSPCGARDWLMRPDAGLRLLATTRVEGLPLLEQALAAAAETQPASITLAIGAEGGWSREEEVVALAAGWQAVSLGPWILRTATAAVSGAGRLAAWRNLSCASCRGPSPGTLRDPLNPADGDREEHRRG
jgi:16S rRNA (uracil1498-N3)-methyltransferase